MTARDITIRVLQSGGIESLITVPEMVEAFIELPNSGGLAVARADAHTMRGLCPPAAF